MDVGDGPDNSGSTYRELCSGKGGCTVIVVDYTCNRAVVARGCRIKSRARYCVVALSCISRVARCRGGTGDRRIFIVCDNNIILALSVITVYVGDSPDDRGRAYRELCSGKGGCTVIIVDYTCYCAVVACGCRVKGCAHYRVVALSCISRVARGRGGTGDRRILIISDNNIILAGLIVTMDVGDGPDDRGSADRELCPGKGGCTVIIVDYTCYCAVVICGCRIKGRAWYCIVTLSCISRVARCRGGTGDRRILIVCDNDIILAGLIIAVYVGDGPDNRGSTYRELGPGKGGCTVIIVDYTCYCAVVACGCRIKGCAWYCIVTLSCISRVARGRDGTGDRRILIVCDNTSYWQCRRHCRGCR